MTIVLQVIIVIHSFTYWNLLNEIKLKVYSSRRFPLVYIFNNGFSIINKFLDLWKLLSIIIRAWSAMFACQNRS